MNLKICYHLLLCFIFISAKKLFNKHKNRINLSFAINNKYIDILLIPLVSLFENSSINSIYHIYILVGKDFEENNSQLLYNLEKIYFNCFIHIINFGSDFEGVYKSFLDISIYYRLKLPILCPNLNRIIYLDSDSIILKDLLQLYTLNFEGNYILARLDKYTDELDKFEIYINNYINTGVMLIDLYNLRKYKYTDKFMKYIEKHNDSLYLNAHDQTLINYVCHDKIGILKPEYHMWPYRSKKDFIEENNELRIKYDLNDISIAIHNPFIVHFPGNFKYKDELRDISYYKTYYDCVIKTKEIKLTLIKR